MGANSNNGKSIVEYKGFIIIIGNYLHGLSTFDEAGNLKTYGTDIPIDYETSSNNYYEIWENGNCWLNTLSNDDKMWTIESATESAKRHIDEVIAKREK